MTKKCLICTKDAVFCIKGTSDCYCEPCAQEQFGDITYLVKVEDEARRLKEAIEETAQGREEETEGVQIKINGK